MEDYNMSNILLIILSIIVLIAALYILVSIPTSFLNEFEKECHKSIENKDKEIEEREKFNRELKKWLFK